MSTKVSLPSVSRGYAFIDGKAAEVQVIDAIIRYNAHNEQSYLRVKYAGGEATVSYENFFKDIQSMRDGKRVLWDNNDWLNDFDNYANMHMDSQTIDYWIMENGVARNHEVCLSEIAVHYDSDGKPVSATCPDIPEGTYDTKQDCYAFNDLTVLDKDGVEKTEKGIGNLCRLTAEQEKMLKKIVDDLKKASEMGLKIVADWNGYYAFNSKELEKYEFEYVSDIDDCDGEDGEYMNVRNEVFQRRILDGITFIGEEDSMFAYRKKEEKND